MKKLVLALLLSAGLVNPTFAAKSKMAELDATIDEVSAQVDDQDAKGVLASMKKHKVATAIIGTAVLAGTAVTADALCHYFWKDDKTTLWNSMWTKTYVVDGIANLFTSKKVEAVADAKNAEAKDANAKDAAEEAKAPKKAKGKGKGKKAAAVEAEEAAAPAEEAKAAAPAEEKGRFSKAKDWAFENKGKIGIGLVAAILVTYDLTRTEKASLIKQLFAKVFKKNAVVA